MGSGPEILVLPAAGLGLRMREVNPDLPKEMLPVGHKPAIQYAACEGVSAGFERIVIIINRKKEIIRRYFEEREFRSATYPLATSEMEEIEERCHISFIYQEQPAGEWDAISLAGDVAGGNPVAVIYPDNIYFPAPGALILLKKAFQRHGKNVIALVGVDEKSSQGLGNSGRVDLSPLTEKIYRVMKFHPKGRGSFRPRFPGELRSCGISIYRSHLFSYIDRGKDSVVEEEEFTDVAVRNLMVADEGILGCRLPGTLFDVGNPEGYNLCLEYIETEK